MVKPATAMAFPASEKLRGSHYRIIPPTRAWLIFNVVTLSIVLAMGVALMRLSGSENQRMIDSQRETLTRSRLPDLNRGDYRSFVEGIGREFSDLYVEIDDSREAFVSGTKMATGHCSEGTLDIGLAGQTKPIRILMCRPYSSPLSTLLILFFVYLLVSIFSVRIVSYLERSSLTALIEFLKTAGLDAKPSEGLVGILSRISDIGTELNDSKKREIESAKSVALGQLAGQVAHDIRSPLMALNVALEDLTQLPENKRSLARNAMARVGDIANNLMERQRGLSLHASSTSLQPNQSNGRTERTSLQLLPTLVENLVTEKRATFRERLALEIRLELGVASYGLFALVQPIEFARLLSNLINNSVEAIENEGTVIVSVGKSGDSILLEVKDTGAGIAPNLIPKLAVRGATFGKETGTGLGLFHAKTTVESWNGQLKIESELQRGTTIQLLLPPATPPEWFVEKVLVEQGRTVVIVDNDVSIHQMWHERLKESASLGSNIREVHLSSLAELHDFASTNHTPKPPLYLVDHHFEDSQETGLSAIGKLGLLKDSLLVTSHHEDAALLAECSRLGVGLLPKTMAGFVPIRTIEN